MAETVHSVRLLIRAFWCWYALTFHFIQVYVLKHIPLRLAVVILLKINYSYEVVAPKWYSWFLWAIRAWMQLRPINNFLSPNLLLGWWKCSGKHIFTSQIGAFLWGNIEISLVVRQSTHFHWSIYLTGRELREKLIREDVIMPVPNCFS